jgi:hypothetical protein
MEEMKKLSDVTLLGNEGAKYNYDYNPGVLRCFANKRQEKLENR